MMGPSREYLEEDMDEQQKISADDRHNKNSDAARKLFVELNGDFSDRGFPFIDSEPFETANGTPYLRAPGVVLLSRPEVDISGVRGFLEGYKMGFEEYLEDDSSVLTDSEQLVKFAGQLCYMSFGKNRSFNDQVDEYVDNLKEQRHGSVLEHVTHTFLIYGLSRAQTHELVRHRVGMGYSQQSQRYVDGKVLRYVERAESQVDGDLHAIFEEDIDDNRRRYERRIEKLIEKQKSGDAMLLGATDDVRRSELRKKVRQAARDILSNEAEAPIVVSMNARSGRHVIEMRAAAAADTAIRETMFRVYLCLVDEEPGLYGDYEIELLKDMSRGITTPFRKV